MRLRAAVPVARTAHPVVVCLQRRLVLPKVVTRPLPVYFIERIGQQNGRRYDAHARGCLEDHFDAAKEEVGVSPDGRRIVAFSKRQLDSFV